MSYLDISQVGFYEKYPLEKLKKEELLEDFNLAECLSIYNKNFGTHFLAQDMDVLNLMKGAIAIKLAWNSYRNGWGETPVAQNLEVLGLGKGDVALGLAWYSGKNGWGQTPAAQDPEVLELGDGKVKKWLDKCSCDNGLSLKERVDSLEFKETSMRRNIEFYKSYDIGKFYENDRKLFKEDLLKDEDLLVGLIKYNKDFVKSRFMLDRSIFMLYVDKSFLGKVVSKVKGLF